tara:strand:+ start:200 stop:313 length:114 start_codon:yes stop_codon:yes gene_type:complete
MADDNLVKSQEEVAALREDRDTLQARAAPEPEPEPEP